MTIRETLRAVWNSEEFWDLIMIVGAIAILLGLIRLLVTVFKNKHAKSYLYNVAEAFDGMAVGCTFIAASGFIQKMWVVGIIAIFLTVAFKVCDHRFIRLFNDEAATQEAQVQLDALYALTEQQKSKL